MSGLLRQFSGLALWGHVDRCSWLSKTSVLGSMAGLDKAAVLGVLAEPTRPAGGSGIALLFGHICMVV